MLFLRRLIITFFKLKIFIFIKRFALKLLITCIFLINLIIINFSFDIFSFIKKENEIHLLMKCRLKSISRKMIVDSCFFITRKKMSRFKNNLSLILIKHFVSKQFNSKRTFLKKLKSSIR